MSINSGDLMKHVDNFSIVFPDQRQEEWPSIGHHEPAAEDVAERGRNDAGSEIRPQGFGIRQYHFPPPGSQGTHHFFRISSFQLSSFRRLKKPRSREMSARGYALYSVCPKLPNFLTVFCFKFPRETSFRFKLSSASNVIMQSFFQRLSLLIFFFSQTSSWNSIRQTSFVKISSSNFHPSNFQTSSKVSSASKFILQPFFFKINLTQLKLIFKVSYLKKFFDYFFIHFFFLKFYAFFFPANMRLFSNMFRRYLIHLPWNVMKKYDLIIKKYYTL